MNKISAQEYADSVVAPEYRQPLKTLDEALTTNGWPLVDHPECCGQEVEIRAFIGSPYFAECKQCGKFVADVTGPHFGNSWVSTPDPQKIDLETDRLWIAGVCVQASEAR